MEICCAVLEHYWDVNKRWCESTATCTVEPSGRTTHPDPRSIRASKLRSHPDERTWRKSGDLAAAQDRLGSKSGAKTIVNATREVVRYRASMSRCVFSSSSDIRRSLRLRCAPITRTCRVRLSAAADYIRRWTSERWRITNCMSTSKPPCTTIPTLRRQMTNPRARYEPISSVIESHRSSPCFRCDVRWHDVIC